MPETETGPAERLLPFWLYEHYQQARQAEPHKFGRMTLDDAVRDAQSIDRGAPVFDYQPGNGTRYLFVMVDTPDGRMVALPYFKAVGFVGRGYVTPDYVEEKLGLKPVDAEVVAEFLTLLSYANGDE